LADSGGIGFDIDNRRMHESVTHFASLIANVRQSLEPYYILQFSVLSNSKATWWDSSVKVHKPEAKVIAASGFFSGAK